jgi:hypothetical protein
VVLDPPLGESTSGTQLEKNKTHHTKTGFRLTKNNPRPATKLKPVTHQLQHQKAPTNNNKNYLGRQSSGNFSHSYDIQTPANFLAINQSRDLCLIASTIS